MRQGSSGAIGDESKSQLEDDPEGETIQGDSGSELLITRSGTIFESSELLEVAPPLVKREIPVVSAEQSIRSSLIQLFVLDVESSVTGWDIVLEREVWINGKCQKLQQVENDVIFIGLGHPCDFHRSKACA